MCYGPSRSLDSFLSSKHGKDGTSSLASSCISMTDYSYPQDEVLCFRLLAAVLFHLIVAIVD